MFILILILSFKYNCENWCLMQSAHLRFQVYHFSQYLFQNFFLSFQANIILIIVYLRMFIFSISFSNCCLSKGCLIENLDAFLSEIFSFLYMLNLYSFYTFVCHFNQIDFNHDLFNGQSLSCFLRNIKFGNSVLMFFLCRLRMSDSTSRTDLGSFPNTHH
jgi:hypothetical protein